MTEQDMFVGRYVVDPIFEFMRRRYERRVERVDLVGQVLRVVEVPEQVEEHYDNSDNYGWQGCLLAVAGLAALPRVATP
jgi:hypothetical protein